MKLRELREAQGMKREELAVKAGVTYSTVANLEAGRFRPKVDLAIKIARVFGVHVEDIEWGKDEPPEA